MVLDEPEDLAVVALESGRWTRVRRPPLVRFFIGPRRLTVCKDTYLNIVLTVIAVLLTVDVWTRIADKSLASDSVMAQSRSQPNRRGGGKTAPQKGVSAIGTEAVDQRALMIKELGQIREQFAGLRALLESGQIKVSVADEDSNTRGASTRRR